VLYFHPTFSHIVVIYTSQDQIGNNGSSQIADEVWSWCGLYGELLFVTGYHENFSRNSVLLITPTVMMRTVAVSERLDTNSTLTKLITEENIIIPTHRESFKSCILYSLFKRQYLIFFCSQNTWKFTHLFNDIIQRPDSILWLVLVLYNTSTTTSWKLNGRTISYNCQINLRPWKLIEIPRTCPKITERVWILNSSQLIKYLSNSSWDKSSTYVDHLLNYNQFLLHFISEFYNKSFRCEFRTQSSGKN
jgi:hypothetical protein